LSEYLTGLNLPSIHRSKEPFDFIGIIFIGAHIALPNAQSTFLIPHGVFDSAWIVCKLLQGKDVVTQGPSYSLP